MQPGAHGLLSRVRSIGPQRATLRQDAMAGLPGSVASVPDGMASAVLAGVNPIHGLYAAFAGPVGGGLTSSTRLMVITTTSAAALAAGSASSSLSCSS
jgi:sulfate permease, SulP family